MKISILFVASLGACLFLLVGCSADPTNAKMPQSADTELGRALQKIEAEYVRNGRHDAFLRVMEEFDPSLRICRQGKVVDFLPKGFKGLDGDFSLLISKETGAVSQPNFGLDGCLPP